MLVLTRKLNQTIVIGEHVVVKVLKVDNGVVRLGIQAPSSIPINRQEVQDGLSKRPAPTTKPVAVPAPVLAETHS